VDSHEDHPCRKDDKRTGELPPREMNQERNREGDKKKDRAEPQSARQKKQHGGYGFDTPNDRGVRITLAFLENRENAPHQEHQPQGEVEPDKGTAERFGRMHGGFSGQGCGFVVMITESFRAGW